MTQRTALYARVSTTRQQEERTVASQLAALEKAAESMGLLVAAEHRYVDEGYSGSRLDRPGLDALRDAAADGLLDLVLVYAPDRLVRNYVHQQIVLEELTYGYRVVRTPQVPQGVVVLDEEEATHVRQMCQIARRLNAQGVRPRKASLWRQSTVYTLLTNPAYVGMATYGKREPVEPTRPRNPGKYRKNAKSSHRARPRAHLPPPLRSAGPPRSVRRAHPKIGPEVASLVDVHKQCRISSHIACRRLQAGAPRRRFHVWRRRRPQRQSGGAKSMGGTG